MGIPWDGMDGTGINCHEMGWNGTEKYVPWTSPSNQKVSNTDSRLSSFSHSKSRNRRQAVLVCSDTKRRLSY